MDDIDIAQANDEMFRQVALRTHFLSRQAVRPDNAATGIRLCMDCLEEIDPARVEANPETFRCIDCQEKHERGSHFGPE